MAQTILITGGTGLVGTYLSPLLLQKGYEVIFLSRVEDLHASIPRYKWDISTKYIDERALERADHIINLAGANLGARRWTKARKKELYDSRIFGTRLLFEKLEAGNFTIQSFISASAIGIYKHSLNHYLDEDGERGEDFLTALTKDWECEIFNMEALDIRTVAFRSGVVFASENSALQKLVQPVKWGIGAPLGSGAQFMSWIHIQDLCHMFIKAIEDESMNDSYNAVASEAVSNKDLTRLIAKKMRKPLFMPKVPAPVLKWMLGEMSDMVLVGHKVANNRIKRTGFNFRFDNLDKTLDDLL